MSGGEDERAQEKVLGFNFVVLLLVLLFYCFCYCFIVIVLLLEVLSSPLSLPFPSHLSLPLSI